MPLRISTFGRSIVGKVRTRNEDTLALEPSMGLVVVADGMGGAPGGDVASATAVREVCQAVGAGIGIREAVLQAHRRIVETAEARPELTGMGTTLTVLQLDPASGSFQVGHVGDSRAYRFQKGGLLQVTEDHTAVADMVKRGTLSPAEARTHPLGHILSRALGCPPEPEVDLILGVAEEGDLFLLCTDGLTKVFRRTELEDRVRETPGRDPEGLVEGLVREADQRGSPDNVTVAAVLVHGGE